MSNVHEVAKTSAITFASLVLATTSLSEIGDGTKFGVKWAVIIIALVESLHTAAGIDFVAKASIYVPHKMVTDVVTDVHFVKRTVFCKLGKEILIKDVKVGLELLLAV